MAYRRKRSSGTRSYTRSRARKSSGRKAATRRTSTRRSSTRRTRTPATQVVRIVLESPASAAALPTVKAAASPRRASF